MVTGKGKGEYLKRVKCAEKMLLRELRRKCRAALSRFYNRVERSNNWGLLGKREDSQRKKSSA